MVCYTYFHFTYLLTAIETPTIVAAMYNLQVLLSRVALGAQRPIVVKLSRERSVGLAVRAYVRRSVCPVHCGKAADRIRMPFGIIGRTGPGMRQVVGLADR